MSEERGHRRPTIAFSDAPRGTCRWCGEPILHERGEKRGEPNRRRRWHPECVDVYNASDPGEARRRVRKRDRGVCAACGLDTRRLARDVEGRGRKRKLRERGFTPDRSLWELDHIVPLIDGGSHDLANLQTLCTPCHKRKTAEEARVRAMRRGESAAATTDQVTLAGHEIDTLRPPRTGGIEPLLARADAVNARVEALLRSFEGSP